MIYEAFSRQGYCWALVPQSDWMFTLWHKLQAPHAIGLYRLLVVVSSARDDYRKIERVCEVLSGVAKWGTFWVRVHELVVS